MRSASSYVIKGEYFVSLWKSVVLNGEYNAMIKSEELTRTKNYLLLWMKYRLKRCRYNRVLLYVNSKGNLNIDAPTFVKEC
jgi:hypothetical protein